MATLVNISQCANLSRAYAVLFEEKYKCLSEGSLCFTTIKPFATPLKALLVSQVYLKPYVHSEILQ